MTINRLEGQNLGRNDPCPVCGRKMKNCRGHRQKLPRWALACLVSSLAILVLFVGLGTIRWLCDQRQPKQVMSEPPLAASPQAIERFKQMMTKHGLGSPDDSWWLMTWPHTPNELNAAASKCEAFQNKMKALLGRYRHVSPLAREIADAFPSFNITVNHRGARIKTSGSVGNEEAVIAKQNLEVCVVPRDEWVDVPVQFCYLQKWKLVIAPAVELPDVVLAALLYHELGHALRYSQNAPSVFLPTDSDADVDEENEMHWLGENVLNIASEGELFKQLDDIIERQVDRSSYQAVILGLTEADFLRCFGCLGVSRPSRIVQSNLDIAIMHVLSLRMIRTSLPSTAWVAEERKLYRWIRRYFYDLKPFSD